MQDAINHQTVAKTSSRKMPLYCALMAILTIASAESRADYATLYFAHPVSPKPLYDRLEIESDGTQYLGTSDGIGRIDTDMELVLGAENFGSVKNWRVWIQYSTANDVTKGWVNLPESLEETYPFGHRPKRVEGTFGLPVHFSAFGATACNQLRNRLRTQGLSDAEIFTVDRQVLLEMRPALSYEMTGPVRLDPREEQIPPPSYENYGDLTLICKAYQQPVSDEGPVRDPFASINYANLVLTYDDQPVECPTEVLAEALFTSYFKGKFNVRLRDAFGNSSKVVELQMSAADKVGNQYVKTWSQQFEVGNPEDDNGSRFPTSVGNKKIVEQEARPLANPGYDFGATVMEELAAPQGDPNQHVNSLWVEIVDAGFGSETESDHEEYRITCPTPGYRVVTDHLIGKSPLGRTGQVMGSKSWPR